MKKVLHLRSSGAMLGAENVIIEIAKNSKKYGFESIIGAIKDKNDEIPELVDVSKSNNIETVVFEHSGIFDFKCAKAIKQFTVQNKIAVIHCHGYKEDFFCIFSRVRLPYIATNHLWKQTTFKLKIYRLLDSILLRRFDRVVGVSNEIISDMKKLGITHLEKIANGIDEKRFVPLKKSKLLMAKYKVAQDNIVIGMVSSLTPEKNHAMAIECLSQINNPKLFLLIVGDGPCKDRLKVLVDAKRLSNNVIFAGWHDDVPELLSIIDIYLLTSLTEGLPMSLLEAMSCKKAVIASRVGDIEAVVENGVNGLIFEVGDLGGLKNAILNIFNNTVNVEYLGSAARKTVTKKFSSILMAKKYCQVYSDLVR